MPQRLPSESQRLTEKPAQQQRPWIQWFVAGGIILLLLGGGYRILRLMLTPPGDGGTSLEQESR